MAHRLSSRARADLDEIWRHIVLEGAGKPAADNTIDLITDRSCFCLSGLDWVVLATIYAVACEALRSPDYVIFYRIAGTDVVIQRVLHGRRDIGRMLTR